MFSWYELGSDICIAMEYFPAGDLQSYLKDHPPLSEAEGREVTGQVLLGLSIMHAHDVVHCDIKPQVCRPDSPKARRLLMFPIILSEHSHPRLPNIGRSVEELVR